MSAESRPRRLPFLTEADSAYLRRELLGQRPGKLTSSIDFGATFSLSDLASVLSTHRLEWPRLRIFRDGEPVAEDDYARTVHRRSGPPYQSLRPAALRREIDQGATIVLDRVDQLATPVMRLTAQVEAALDAPAFVNAYASWGSKPGFGRHWDDHDVFVLQVAGDKTWSLWEPTRRWPRFIDVVDTPEPDTEPTTMSTRPGDIIYIPHGWWHQAQPTSAPSLHLTIGVNFPAGTDLLAWIAERSPSIDLFRQPLPPSDQPDARAEYLRRLAQATREIVESPDLIDEYHETRGAEAAARRQIALPDHDHAEPAPDAIVTVLTPRARLRRDGPTLALRADGKQITLHPRSEPIVRYLLDTTVARIHELTALDDARFVWHAVLELESEGVVGIEPRTSPAG